MKILTEASIGSGVRRVEALVGIDAFGFLAKEHLLVSRLAELFRVPADQVADRVEQTVAQLRDAEKELERLRAAAVLAGAGALARAARDVGGVASSRPRRPRARPAATTCARWRRRSAAGYRPARPAVVVAARSARQGHVHRGHERGGPAARTLRGRGRARAGPVVGGRGGGMPIPDVP